MADYVQLGPDGEPQICLHRHYAAQPSTSTNTNTRNTSSSSIPLPSASRPHEAHHRRLSFLDRVNIWLEYQWLTLRTECGKNRFSCIACSIVVGILLTTAVIVGISRGYPTHTAGHKSRHHSSSSLLQPRQRSLLNGDPDSSSSLVTIRDLRALHSLPLTTTSIRVEGLSGWSSGLIKVNTSLYPNLSTIIVNGEITEHALQELVGALSSTVRTLSLDMHKLSLGGRLDRRGLMALSTRSVLLPSLRSLIIQHSYSCPLTPWALSWDCAPGTTVTFCASIVDQNAVAALERRAAALGGTRQRVVLQNTTLVTGFKSNLVTVSKALSCPVPER